MHHTVAQAYTAKVIGVAALAHLLLIVLAEVAQVASVVAAQVLKPVMVAQVLELTSQELEFTMLQVVAAEATVVAHLA
jgi:hypothetical protein